MTCRCLLPALALAANACVAYRPLDADLATVAATAAARTGGSFTFHSAVALAMRQNPDVLRATALARAAATATTPFYVDVEWDDNDDMLAVLVDPIALLGLGARGGTIGVLDAEALAAARELTVARWRTMAAIAETFLVEDALAAWQPPRFEVDAAAFERAGLAAAVDARRLEAAQARAAAEAVEVENLRAQNRAELRRLLGLHAAAEVAFEPSPRPLLQQPPTTDEVLARRPDLLLAEAELLAADAAFRRAVAEQYPSLMLGPDFPLQGGGGLQAMARLRLPIGMHGAAAAAGDRRDASAQALMAAWLAAQSEASSAEAELAAAVAGEAAAAAMRQASEEALRTAVVAVQIEVDAFGPLPERAAMAVRDATEHRMAALRLARAGLRRAVALGWPLTGHEDRR